MAAFEETVFPLIINSSNLVPDSFNNKYRYVIASGGTRFKNAKVAVASIAIYYSWYNITASQNNNSFQFVWPTNAGSTTYTVTIQDGYYSVANLNSYLQQFCITNGLYLVDGSGNFVYYLEFLENVNYYSVQVNTYALPTSLPSGWSNPASMSFPLTTRTPQLIVPNTNFQYIIGYTPGTYPAAPALTTQSFLSTFTPQVSPVQSVILSCSLLSNKYANPMTVLYSFSASGFEFGNLVQSSPYEHTYVDISDGNFSFFDIAFLDQNYNAIKLNDTNIVVQLLIKSKQS